MLKGPDTDNPGLEASRGKCAEDQAAAGRSWDPSLGPRAGPAAHASLVLLTRHKPGQKTGEGSQEASLPGAKAPGDLWGCPWTSPLPGCHPGPDLGGHTLHSQQPVQGWERRAPVHLSSPTLPKRDTLGTQIFPWGPKASPESSSQPPLGGERKAHFTDGKVEAQKGPVGQL